MKKIIIFSLITIALISHADAGLFEYYLGNETKTNASKAESVDAVETINYTHPNSVSEKPWHASYSKYNSYTHIYPYSDTKYDWTYGNFRQSRRYYTNNVYDYNGFYKCDDLQRNLEDERKNLEREADYIDDIIDDLKDRLRDAKRYTTSYYRDLRRQLEKDIDDLEDRADYIEDLESDIKKEIREIKNDCTYSSDSHAYYFDYYGNNYYDKSYNYDNYFYYNRYGNNNSYIKYENDSYYSEYQPWVNTNLKPVKDGRIYIN